MKNRNITFTAILFALVCLALAPMAQTVGPDTDGAIPGSNNGEGIGVLVSRTTGVWNTGTGFEALSQLTGGNQNTATGLRALTSDTNGGFNTATGVYSLFSNINGFFNSATGAYSLANNISGIHNTANGYAALYRNTAGDNTATGFAALYHNTTGNANTAVGSGALSSNADGAVNDAFGLNALSSHTTGVFNTAIGANALLNDTIGQANVAVGNSALQNSTGSGGNIALGASAGVNVNTASDVICIGNLGQDVDNSCYIGQIFGQSVALGSGTPVLVDSDGKLGTLLSSRRFKHDIKPMEKASEALLALRPVTFHYKSDTKDTRQVGLIAEEVAEVSPDLIVRDKNGEILSVRYDQVNAMLLNEFLKEHRKVQEQDATIAQVKSTAAKQEATIAQQRKDFEALTAGLQKVSDQLAAASPSRGGL